MPRKDKALSVKIAPATPRVAETSTGEMALGKICRKMILTSRAPMARAARTKSRSRRDRNSARTRRATPIQLVKPMMIMMFQMDGSKNAITARIRKKAGKHSMISTKRMISESTQRP